MPFEDDEQDEDYDEIKPNLKSQKNESTASAGGKSETSRLGKFGMNPHLENQSEPEDEDEEEEDDDEEEPEEKAKPSAKSKKGDIDYDKLADKIQARQRPQPQPVLAPVKRHDDPLKRAVQKLHQNGADPDALTGLLEVMDAHSISREEQERNARKIEKFQEFHASLDEMFEDEVETAVKLVPKLAKMKASILEELVNEWHKSDYDDERRKIDKQRKPDKRMVSKAVQKVTSRFAKEYGIQTNKPSVSVKQGKPKIGTKGGSLQDQINRLDANQKKYFDAFKGLGVERALQSARTIKTA